MNGWERGGSEQLVGVQYARQGGVGRGSDQFRSVLYTVGKARASLLLPSDISILFHEHT
jgi:hypothetical protein